MAGTGTDSFPAFHQSSDQSAASHTAVGYLFGGLASTMGLIALALLILACSYLKLSGTVAGEDAGDGNDSGNRDLETGEGKINEFEEKILVIMAGQQKPTFIATPITSRGYSMESSGLRVTEDDPLTEKTMEGRRTDQVCMQSIESHIGTNHYNP